MIALKSRYTVDVREELLLLHDKRVVGCIFFIERVQTNIQGLMHFWKTKGNSGSGEDFSFSKAKNLALNLYRAVAHLHDKHMIYHGEICPRSILVTPEHDVKFLDLGYAMMYTKHTEAVPSKGCVSDYSREDVVRGYEMARPFRKEVYFSNDFYGVARIAQDALLLSDTYTSGGFAVGSE